MNPKLNAVPMAKAVLCANCECIHDGGINSCPICQSQAQMYVTSVLGVVNQNQISFGLDRVQRLAGRVA